MAKHQDFLKQRGQGIVKKPHTVKLLLIDVISLSCWCQIALLGQQILKKINVWNVELFSLPGIVRLSGEFTVKPRSDLRDYADMYTHLLCSFARAVVYHEFSRCVITKPVLFIKYSIFSSWDHNLTHTHTYNL